MKNQTPANKKKPITAHRGRIVYQGRGRPIGGGGRPMPGRPRPFPWQPRGPRRGPRVTPRPFRPRPGGIPRDFMRGFTKKTWANPATSRPEQQMRDAAISSLRKVNEQARGNARRDQLIAEGEATRAGNKGMAVTKKAIGHNDFRKGGLTLSIVDNLKK